MDFTNIKNIRQAHGLTQTDLARQTGLTPQCISRLESGARGRAVRVGTLELIMAALGCGLDEMAGLNREPTPR